MHIIYPLLPPFFLFLSLFFFFVSLCPVPTFPVDERTSTTNGFSISAILCCVGVRLIPRRVFSFRSTSSQSEFSTVYNAVLLLRFWMMRCLRRVASCWNPHRSRNLRAKMFLSSVSAVILRYPAQSYDNNAINDYKKCYNHSTKRWMNISYQPCLTTPAITTVPREHAFCPGKQV